MKYCPECGSPFSSTDINNRRINCSKCGYVNYSQLKVGAGAIIEKGNMLLLIKRKHEPFKDAWNIPAGYVEVDECPEQAVVRETYEETNLKIECNKLENIFFFNDDPRGNGILIVYSCNVLSGIAMEREEAYSPSYFDKKHLPENLAGGGHNKAIAYWKGSIRKE
jgi:ADP-ribose pyrophosphatase YjhB (NUDIX family)